ncbi:anti-sigma B factor antagonist [Pseudonocardia sediminis]|uniref:Anti-sigma factor antagonist n=1 Tax=Pseudonocardia sediminis TaxID=1397368 RepID=A0A4Q7UTK3_PSEST|nr:anti-sigma B factor antagonist [Pseudonocardia sediminis]
MAESPRRACGTAGIVACVPSVSPNPEVITLLGSASAHQPDEPGDVGAALSVPRDGLTLLTVSGEVDTLTSPQLSTALDDLLAVETGDLAIDLDGVTFLASSGLGVLINAARRASRGRRTLHVVASSRAVLRPLEVTGSAQLFTVVRSLDEVPRCEVPSSAVD